MDNQMCPRCKTTKYRNPSLKLLVNVCGHTLCESCVELLFVRIGGQCPECGTAIKKTDYRVQFFEDSSIEKELEVRRNVLKVFNKKEEDFPSLRMYNDYLEDIENMIFSIVNNDANAEANKKRISAYKKENKELILQNRSRKSKDELYIEAMLAREKDSGSRWQALQKEEMAKEQKTRLRHNEELIDDLMFCDGPASSILDSHKIKREHEQKAIDAAAAAAQAKPKSPPSTTFSTGIQMGQQSQTTYLPMKVDQNPLYEYTPVMLDFLGPEPPAEISLKEYGFLEHIRASGDAQHAGGFTSAMACCRALQEAVSGLYYPFGAASTSETDSSDDSASESDDVQSASD